MALIYSNNTGGGNASDTASWDGGVVPTSADDVNIRAGDTITLDGTIHYTKLDVYGTLSDSRTITTSIQTDGNMTFYSGSVMDFGTEASPITETYKLTVIVNSPGRGTYGITVKDGVTINVCGAEKVVNTELTADALSGQNKVFLADISGLQVGDLLVFEHYNVTGSLNGSEYFETEITAINIATKEVTLNDNLTYDMDGTTSPFFVANTSHSILFRPGVYPEVHTHNSAPYFVVYRTSTASNNKFLFKHATLSGFSPGTYRKQGHLIIYSNTNTSFAQSNEFDVKLDGVSFRNGYFNGFQPIYCYVEAKNINSTMSGALLPQYYYSCWGVTFNFNSKIVGYNWLFIYINRGEAVKGQRSANSTITELKVANCGVGLLLDEEYNLTLINPTIRKTNSAVRTVSSAGFSSLGGEIMHTGTIASSSGFGKLLMTDLKVLTTPRDGYATESETTFVELNLANKDVNPDNQITYFNNGYYEKDNAVYKNGNSSLKFTPSSFVQPMTKTWNVVAIDNELVQVGGYIRMNSAFNGNLPKLKLTGLGITKVEWEVPGGYTADEWIQFSLTTTQTSGADGTLNLKAIVDGTAGNVWIDSISAPAPVAIDTGAMGVWAGASPSNLIASNFTTAKDFWAQLTSENQVSGSFGEAFGIVKKWVGWLRSLL